MLPTHADVVIVGAGPTGLTLAAALRQAGIDHVLIDRQASGASESRAAVVHARTLEVLSELSVTDATSRRSMTIRNVGGRSPSTSCGLLTG